jgi:hypothetical protein
MEGFLITFRAICPKRRNGVVCGASLRDLTEWLVSKKAQDY